MPKSAMEEWIEQVDANTKLIGREIKILSSMQQSGEFWKQAEKISGLFETVIPLMKGDRKRLWTKFSQICAEKRGKEREEWEARRLDSRRARELLEKELEEVYRLVKDAQGMEDLSKAESLLSQWLDWFTQIEMIWLLEGDRRACWKKRLEVRKVLQQRQKEIRNANYQRLKKEVEEAFNLA